MAEEENVVDDVTCVVVWLNTNAEPSGRDRHGKGNGRRSSLPTTHEDKSRRERRNNSVSHAEVDKLA